MRIYFTFKFWTPRSLEGGCDEGGDFVDTDDHLPPAKPRHEVLHLSLRYADGFDDFILAGFGARG